MGWGLMIVEHDAGVLGQQCDDVGPGKFNVDRQISAAMARAGKRPALWGQTRDQPIAWIAQVVADLAK